MSEKKTIVVNEVLATVFGDADVTLSIEVKDGVLKYESKAGSAGSMSNADFTLIVNNKTEVKLETGKFEIQLSGGKITKMKNKLDGTKPAPKATKSTTKTNGSATMRGASARMCD